MESTTQSKLHAFLQETGAENQLKTIKTMDTNQMENMVPSSRLNEFIATTTSTANETCQPMEIRSGSKLSAFLGKKVHKPPEPDPLEEDGSKAIITTATIEPEVVKLHKVKHFKKKKIKQAGQLVSRGCGKGFRKLQQFLRSSNSPQDTTDCSSTTKDVIYSEHESYSLRPLKRPKRIHYSKFVQRRGTYVISTDSNLFSIERKRQNFLSEMLAIRNDDELFSLSKSEHGTKVNLVSGMKCYVPDKDEVWLMAEITKYDEKSGMVFADVESHDGSIKKSTINIKDKDIIKAVGGKSAKEISSLPLASSENPEGIEDMKYLKYLNEPSILSNLRKRFFTQNPYTYTNNIVIAVNPYQWLGELYEESVQKLYLTHSKDELPPHVYSTSAAAHRNMINTQNNQSILVSGESGAGKTETTKILMNHIASIAGGLEAKTISKVIAVNPLLESFGNAKTLRNDNSSRFGKFTQMQFNSMGKLIGAKCETYLLEKSRVVSFMNGERNYHIFYQVVLGLPKETLISFNLSETEYFNYIGVADNMKMDNIDDKKSFEATKLSLELIGMDHDNQHILYQLLAGILHLGQVEFEDIDDDRSKVVSQKQLHIVAGLLGLPAHEIEVACCNRTVTAGNESYTLPLSSKEAREGRCALAKSIYSKIFDWMVHSINNAIGINSTDVFGKIGVLDIFGFEDFLHNGFEQFCINYANEKLQQKFTFDVFKSVEEEYYNEGLNWDHIQYSDNQHILSMIDSRMGIIAMMNDHLRQPRGTEEAFVNKLKTAFKKNKTEASNYIEFPKTKKTKFCINHYAGSVTYESVGFMEKHQDILLPDLENLIKSSTIDFIQELFDSSNEFSCSSEVRASDIRTSDCRASHRRKIKSSTYTLGTQFKMSLNSLMENIATTESYYIRCVKPNANKSCQEIDKKMVVQQLRCAGVIDAIRISRANYPSRLSHEDFLSKYRMMFPSPSTDTSDLKETCVQFLTALKRNSPVDYQIGKTLIYFKEGILEELVVMKSDFIYDEATTIQKVVLGFLDRQKFSKKIRSCIKLQSLTRMKYERDEYALLRSSALIVQRFIRGYFGRLASKTLINDQIQKQRNDILKVSEQNIQERLNAKVMEILSPVKEGQLCRNNLESHSLNSSPEEFDSLNAMKQSLKLESVRRAEELKLKAFANMKKVRVSMSSIPQYKKESSLLKENVDMLIQELQDLRYEINDIRTNSTLRKGMYCSVSMRSV